MSYNHILVCMDCKCGLDLGRAVKSYVGEGRKPRFSYESIGGAYISLGQDDNEPVYDIEFVEVLQQFMLRHHMHELRVMPETIQKYESEGGNSILDCLVDYEDYQEYINETFEKPNPKEECEQATDELKRKISNF